MFKLQNCLQIFTEPFVFLQVKYFLTLLFLPFFTQAKLLLNFVLEDWGQGVRTRWGKRAAAQPSGPLLPLPNTCHQGEWTRFSKMTSTVQTLPFHTMMNLHKFSATDEICACGNQVLCFALLELSVSPSPRALYWTTSMHPQQCSCHPVTSTAVRKSKWRLLGMSFVHTLKQSTLNFVKKSVEWVGKCLWVPNAIRFPSYYFLLK